jgi:hypothetical protein
LSVAGDARRWRSLPLRRHAKPPLLDGVHIIFFEFGNSLSSGLNFHKASGIALLLRRRHPSHTRGHE